MPDESQLDAAMAVRDGFRVDYFRGYLAAAVAAKDVDGVRLEVSRILTQHGLRSAPGLWGISVLKADPCVESVAL